MELVEALFQDASEGLVQVWGRVEDQQIVGSHVLQSKLVGGFLLMERFWRSKAPFKSGFVCMARDVKCYLDDG